MSETTQFLWDRAQNDSLSTIDNPDGDVSGLITCIEDLKSQVVKLQAREALLSNCLAEVWVSSASPATRLECRRVLSRGKDNAELREVCARVLDEVEHMRWSTKLAIQQLRSGEWIPEILK